MIFEVKKDGHRVQRTATPKATTAKHPPDASYVVIDGEPWLQIEDSHLMPEFFTTPVSSDNHWMFVSSHGAVTAGRENADHALFPYYPSDKLSDMASSAGTLTLIRIARADGSTAVWRPFVQPLGETRFSRNLYKNVDGNRLLFEEVNHDLSLVFRYQWAFGKEFGFVRTCEIVNLSAGPVTVELLDGLQNLMPPGLSKTFQLQYSNLGDAYKRSELLEPAGIGLFYLSSIPTDRAEPSEGLRATAAWQLGLSDPTVLLSSRQVDRFVATGSVEQERETRGCRGAYLIQTKLELEGLGSADWQIVANVDQNGSDVARLRGMLQAQHEVDHAVSSDVDHCQHGMTAIVSSADGRQSGALTRQTHRHQSNVMYNVMRGGLPVRDYDIFLQEFADCLAERNRVVYRQHGEWLRLLGETIPLSELLEKLAATGDENLLRLGREYLPLTFSRRHGDPSRPWNRFSIDLYNEDGSQKIAYEGNWRDIFQNWEAVAFSWPKYTANMVRRFVNSSTADGYNPYRITHLGIDWEAPSEEAFTNIGYWGDHQIVYLLKLLEWLRASDPQATNLMLSETGCTYALVPYRIVDYDRMKVDPCETIEFDHELEKTIDGLVDVVGTDGKLLQSSDGNILHATMIEKLMLPALVKMTNLVPNGGIWLNTQRPEWNDANNALVGNGLSVVTACYLRRYFVFLTEWFTELGAEESHEVSANVAQLTSSIGKILDRHQAQFAGTTTPQERREIVDALSQAGTDHRNTVYAGGLSQLRQSLKLGHCIEVFGHCIAALDDCIATNKRGDGLYHSYNLMRWQDDGIEVERLAEMLEGQVAAISSGALSTAEVCDVLDALRNSRLYRADQDSYTLYPDRKLTGFVEKNVVPNGLVDQSELLLMMLRDGDHALVERDVDGNVRFHADFRNVDVLHERLDGLAKQDRYTALIDAERSLVAEAYEETFRHRRFTGRSENFFAYEGLGSIYWHMVSKLALATIEQFISATRPGEEQNDGGIATRLRDHYVAIREGLGVNKTPAHFGAFPTDPYSHTPAHAGAQQPGMTGQVKEDVLCRMFEIGARVANGIVSFEPRLFDVAEFHQAQVTFDFVGLDQQNVRLSLGAGDFAWTWCQVPILYHRSDRQGLVVTHADGQTAKRDELSLTAAETDSLFGRDGRIQKIDVYFDPARFTEGQSS